MSTTQTASPQLVNGLAAIAFARRNTSRLLETIPEDKLTYQPVPGANHALWVMGHLAYADDMFRSTLGKQDRKFPEAWTELFGMGSQPVDDPSKYPPVSELRQCFDQTHEALVAWFGSMSDADLAQPLPEDWRSFAETNGALMSTLAAHESMHTGQLTIIRKGLGLKPVMG